VGVQHQDKTGDVTNMAQLVDSGEPIPTSCAPSTCAPSRQSRHPDPDDQPPLNTDPFSSQTQRGRGGGGRPRGTGDDPFGINDLDEDEPPKGKSKQLEGVTPTKFSGDRSKTLSFLAEFKRFMNMNHDADIA
jgi:hypothetical protein